MKSSRKPKKARHCDAKGRKNQRSGLEMSEADAIRLRLVMMSTMAPVRSYIAAPQRILRCAKRMKGGAREISARRMSSFQDVREAMVSIRVATAQAMRCLDEIQAADLVLYTRAKTTERRRRGGA